MNTGFSLHSARAENAAVNKRGSSLPLIARLRFQLPGALVFCVFLPTILRGQSLVHGSMPATAVNATAAAAIAVICSYALSRRLNRFPGIQHGVYALVWVTVSFGLVALAFLVFRFDYSRFILFTSYGLSLGWFAFINLVNERFNIPQLAVVPGGNADEVFDLKGIQWEALADPRRTPHGVAGIVADLRSELSDDWERFLTDCTLHGIPVYHTKQVAESLTGRVQIEHLSENTFGSLLPSLFYLKAKEAIDFAIALLVLPVFGLIFLVIAPLVLTSSPGPVIFRQQRVGYRGDQFTIYKFRTMNCPPADAGQDERDAAITKTFDQRITRIGSVLRRYRLDEAPQIINILKGEMSWIGPRPEAVALSEWYENELPFYRYRHVVRPGISGWAQVNQGHVADPGEVHDKLHYDFFYIKHLSPWLDLLIVFRTIETILRGFGSK